MKNRVNSDCQKRFLLHATVPLLFGYAKNSRYNTDQYEAFL
jgi:hypothetical protein